MKRMIEIPEEEYNYIKNHENAFDSISTKILVREAILSGSNGVVLPANATNGDVVKTIYPQEPIVFVRDGKYIKISGEHFSAIFDVEWWNASYKEGKKMKKTVCDICGKDMFDDNLELREKIERLNLAMSRNGKYMDICQDCRDELWKWMKKRKESRNEP